MAGERVPFADVSALGVHADRTWAVRDVEQRHHHGRQEAARSVVCTAALRADAARRCRPRTRHPRCSSVFRTAVSSPAPTRCAPRVVGVRGPRRRVAGPAAISERHQYPHPDGHQDRPSCGVRPRGRRARCRTCRCSGPPSSPRSPVRHPPSAVSRRLSGAHPDRAEPGRHGSPGAGLRFRRAAVPAHAGRGLPRRLRPPGVGLVRRRAARPARRSAAADSHHPLRDALHEQPQLKRDRDITRAIAAHSRRCLGCTATSSRPAGSPKATC